VCVRVCVCESISLRTRCANHLFLDDMCVCVYMCVCVHVWVCACVRVCVYCVRVFVCVYCVQKET